MVKLLKCAPQDGIFDTPPLGCVPKQATLKSKDLDEDRLDLICHAFSKCGLNGVVVGVTEGSAKQEGAAMTKKVLFLEIYYIVYSYGHDFKMSGQIVVYCCCVGVGQLYSSL